MKFPIIVPLFVSLFLFGCSHEKKPKEVKEDPVVTLTDAYNYGFLLVLMDMTRETMTNVASPGQVKGRAPINQFVHMKEFPDASYKDVVRPNVDTLYSSAWLDLSNGPMVLEIPDTKGRYYLMPMLDAWTNIYNSPGKRTTGTDAQKYIVAGPKWKGQVPEGFTLVQSPTELTWIIGRIQTNSMRDGKMTVANIQNDLKLYPMDKIGKSYTPPAGRLNQNISSAAPLEKVYSLSTEEFFNRLNGLLVNNPPTAADQQTIARFSKVGIAPGAQFSLAKFNEEKLEAIKNIPGERKDHFEENIGYIGEERNHWSMPKAEIGAYGTDYRLRAIVAHHGLGANLTADAIYPTAMSDGLGNRLNGNKRYVLHFDKDSIPPVNAFWSLTAYGDDGLLIENPINRSAIGDRSNLVFNRDGSLDIYIQKDSPGEEREGNWLPVGKGNFSITARLYWPTASALNANFTLPPIMPSGDRTPISYNKD